MSGKLATTTLSAIAAIAPVFSAVSFPQSQSPPWEPLLSASPQMLANASARPIQLVDRVVAGSDFDEFRDRLWQAVQRRDRTFLAELFPDNGIFIGTTGPVSPDGLALDDPDSPFWRSLEKMLAPHSCELEDFPGTLPDAAVWGCPNIASAIAQPPAADSEDATATDPEHVVVVGRGVNVRSRPRLGTSVIGRLSNEVVEFDHTTWQELRRTAPETTDDPIDGWTPVILPNRAQGYVYNRYVYHLEGPRALFEQIDGRWQLLRIVFGEEMTVTP